MNPLEKELSIFLGVKKTLQEASEPIIDPDHFKDRQPGDIEKREVTRGSTRIIVNYKDSEILAAMPDTVSDNARLKKDAGVFMAMECPKDGHLMVWIRMTELNPTLGRWVYFEIITNISELRHCPKGESARAYREFMAIIGAYASHIDHEAWANWVLNNTKCYK